MAGETTSTAAAATADFGSDAASSSSYQQAQQQPAEEEVGGLTTQQQKAQMLADEDPLLISQSLTYVTDDGSVLHSFQSARYSTGTLIYNKTQARTRRKKGVVSGTVLFLTFCTQKMSG